MKFLFLFYCFVSIISCREKNNATYIDFVISVQRSIERLKPGFCIGTLEESKTISFVVMKENNLQGRTLLDSFFTKSNLYAHDTIQIKYATLIYPENTFNQIYQTNRPLKNESIVCLYDVKSNCIKDSFSLKTNGPLSFYYKEIADSVYKRIGTTHHSP